MFFFKLNLKNSTYDILKHKQENLKPLICVKKKRKIFRHCHLICSTCETSKIEFPENLIVGKLTRRQILHLDKTSSIAIPESVQILHKCLLAFLSENLLHSRCNFQI